MQFMNQFIQKPGSDQWVLYAPDRANRPHLKSNDMQSCPLETGHEDQTPPESGRIGPGDINQPGWQVRAVPNLFPLTEHHEVIVLSPSHQASFGELSNSHVDKILTMYQQRWIALSRYGQPFIFHNHQAAAGASLPHPHSQIAVIPNHIRLKTEPRQKPRHLIVRSQWFEAFCPEASEFPYETWLQPIDSGDSFKFSTLDPACRQDLAALLNKLVGALQAIQDNMAYNFYIAPQTDWFVRIIGRITPPAGFELGTHIAVNPIPPAVAAKKLQMHFPQKTTTNHNFKA